jgi:hypothetical protein
MIIYQVRVNMGEDEDSFLFASYTQQEHAEACAENIDKGRDRHWLSGEGTAYVNTVEVDVPEYVAFAKQDKHLYQVTFDGNNIEGVVRTSVTRYEDCVEQYTEVHPSLRKCYAFVLAASKEEACILARKNVVTVLDMIAGKDVRFANGTLSGEPNIYVCEK